MEESEEALVRGRGRVRSKVSVRVRLKVRVGVGVGVTSRTPSRQEGSCDCQPASVPG